MGVLTLRQSLLVGWFWSLIVLALGLDYFRSCLLNMRYFFLWIPLCHWQILKRWLQVIFALRKFLFGWYLQKKKKRKLHCIRYFHSDIIYLFSEEKIIWNFCKNKMITDIWNIFSVSTLLTGLRKWNSFMFGISYA